MHKTQIMEQKYIDKINESTDVLTSCVTALRARLNELQGKYEPVNKVLFEYVIDKLEKITEELTEVQYEAEEELRAETEKTAFTNLKDNQCCKQSTMEKPKDTFIDDTLAVRLGLKYNDKEDSFEGCKNGNTISVKQPSDGILSVKFSLNIEKMTNGEFLKLVNKLEDFYKFNVTQN